MKIVLASGSPRRRELLSLITENFAVCPADADESLRDGAPLADEVVRLSRLKAEAAMQSHPDAVCIGSDTMVTIDHLPLGKPKDRADAADMLRRLRGRTHEVLTGLAVLSPDGGAQTLCTRTEVTFRDFSEEELEEYLATGEPLDKAGAYGIQGHGALLIEDAAESMGATYKGRQTGSFGDYAAISYNGNKIITGSSGGCLLTNDLEVANKARKWSKQARENTPWYQHEEVGYNYRMSNVIAGVVRGQYPYLEEHIAQKKAIWERYRDCLRGLPVEMNPFDPETSCPNYWLSALVIDRSAMCRQVRSDNDALYLPEQGKSCPTEILEAIAGINAEGRPIWKPMHMQPMYRMNGFITASGDGRAKANAYIAGGVEDVGADIFERGLCLPSDNKMTKEQQEQIIKVIRRCFE